MTDLFISYSTRHPVYAYVIEKHLDDEGKYTYWRDVRRIKPGKSWKSQIEEGIRAATVVAVIVTREAVKSKEVRNEISLAVEENKALVPIIMEKFPNYGIALQKLGLEQVHAINFVTEELAGFTLLSETLKTLTNTWAPLAKEIVRLGHFSWNIRQKAVKVLGESGDPRVIEPLVEAYDAETEIENKIAVARQLAHFDDPLAVDVVVRLAFPSSRPSSHSSATRLLSEMLARFPSVEQHVEASIIRIENPQERRSAISALVFSGYPGTKVMLHRLLQKELDPELQYLIESHLKQDNAV